MSEWEIIRETAWCRIIGISPGTARRWEQQGIIGPPRRIANQRWRLKSERPRFDNEHRSEAA